LPSTYTFPVVSTGNGWVDNYRTAILTHPVALELPIVA
jgi:hypothetical protein